MDELLERITLARGLVERAAAGLRTGETVETEADAHHALREAAALLKMALTELEDES